MSNERDRAARSIRQLGEQLVAAGKRLRRLGPRDLSEENLFVVRQAVDELRAVVNEAATSLEVAKIN